MSYKKKSLSYNWNEAVKIKFRCIIKLDPHFIYTCCWSYHNRYIEYQPFLLPFYSLLLLFLRGINHHSLPKFILQQPLAWVGLSSDYPASEFTLNKPWIIIFCSPPIKVGLCILQLYTDLDSQTIQQSSDFKLYSWNVDVNLFTDLV